MYILVLQSRMLTVSHPFTVGFHHCNIAAQLYCLKPSITNFTYLLSYNDCMFSIRSLLFTIFVISSSHSYTVARDGRSFVFFVLFLFNACIFLRHCSWFLLIDFWILTCVIRFYTVVAHSRLWVAMLVEIWLDFSCNQTRNNMKYWHTSMLGGSLVTMASSGCGWRRQPPDMEDSCKYIE
jgi:hypothetical protein